MKRLFLLIFFVVGYSAFGQVRPPTKYQLLKLFKNSVKQDHSDKVSTNSNPWVICNKNGLFYTADTLKLYNNINYYYHSSCCDFIDWTFYKKDAFVLTRVQICKEPTTASVPKNEDWFVIKVSNQGKYLFLETYNQGRMIDRFQVLSIDKVNYIGQPNDITDVVTLVRMGKQ